jgi:hypothetical protein
MESLVEFTNRMNAIVDSWPMPTARERLASAASLARAAASGAGKAELRALHAFVLSTTAPSVERAVFCRGIGYGQPLTGRRRVRSGRGVPASS